MRTAVAVLLLLLAAVVLRTAWVSDDAFITFRTVDHALNGHGLRWNLAERVQSYTHPLWMLLLLPSVALTGSPYLASLLLSLALTALVIALFVLPMRDRPAAVAAGLAVFLFSKAFVDYSTGGLENPLSHALLAALMVITVAPWLPPPRNASVDPWRPGGGGRPWRCRAMTIGLLTALIALSRLDLLLLAAPIALAGIRPAPGPRPLAPANASGIPPAPGPWPLAPAVLGLTPLAIWTLFSLAYYGVPFPNTAYAKLSTGVPQEMLTRQGFRYLGESLERDPVTLPVIALAILAPALVWLARAVANAAGGNGRSGERPYGVIAVAVAILLYVAYVVRIGGDFMSGRFLAAPLVVSVFVLQRLPWPRRARPGLAIVLVVTGIGLTAREPSVALLAKPPIRELADMWTPIGIVDERAFYFERTAFLSRDGLRTEPRQHDLQALVADLRNQHPRTVVYQTVGMIGYYVGPDRHIIDTLALNDPLLARLPAIPPWRVGHYQRPLPEGYWESVDTDSNRIEDPEIAALYERIRLATRAPLWTRERWQAIVELNWGR